MKRFTDYDSFAQVYNSHWSDFPYIALPALERLALDESPPGAAILDLCCGTGHLAKLLIERGYTVTGVDGSERMLDYARQNAPQAAFVCADARAFELPEAFDIVFSTYDSLNHIMSLDELSQVFKRVHDHLRDGGRFVFDMNLEAGYPARWEGPSNVVSGLAVVAMQGIYDEADKQAFAQLTIFTRCEDEPSRWERKDLFMRQRAYSVEEISDALAEQGFVDIEAFDAERDFKLRQPGRAFFRARKAQDERGGHER